MFYEYVANGYVLRIRVSPNASRCMTNGIFLGADGTQFLKVSLVAVPEKGKANQELIRFLSKALGLSKSCFKIVAGETDRYKKVVISVENNAQLENLLQKMEQINVSNSD